VRQVTLTLDQQFSPHPEVVDTELDEQETVLLHLRTQFYYTLNQTGTRIWQGFKKHLTLSQISQQLQREFAVEPETADFSLLQFVDGLCQRELVLIESVNSK
jgi:hypothetical protein